MSRMTEKRERLSIDVLPNERRQIKAYAALNDKTIREYVLECVRERLKSEKQYSASNEFIDPLNEDPVLKKLWSNDRDKVYDNL